MSSTFNPTPLFFSAAFTGTDAELQTQATSLSGSGTAVTQGHSSVSLAACSNTCWTQQKPFYRLQQALVYSLGDTACLFKPYSIRQFKVLFYLQPAWADFSAGISIPPTDLRAFHCEAAENTSPGGCFNNHILWDGSGRLQQLNATKITRAERIISLPPRDQVGHKNMPRLVHHYHLGN